jgi:hypothetical protein
MTAADDAVKAMMALATTIGTGDTRAQGTAAAAMTTTRAAVTVTATENESESVNESASARRNGTKTAKRRWTARNPKTERSARRKRTEAALIETRRTATVIVIDAIARRIAGIVDKKSLSLFVGLSSCGTFSILASCRDIKHNQQIACLYADESSMCGKLEVLLTVTVILYLVGFLAVSCFLLRYALI